jgi:hypothetical protein
MSYKILITTKFTKYANQDIGASVSTSVVEFSSKEEARKAYEKIYTDSTRHSDLIRHVDLLF